jgi:hypothetical protein
MDTNKWVQEGANEKMGTGINGYRNVHRNGYKNKWALE